MEVSINEQENKDNYNGDVDNDDEPRDGKNKRVKLSEPRNSGNETENVKGDMAISKSGQLARMSNVLQGTPPFAARKEGRGGRSGPVQFEFHFPEEVWLMILNMVEDEDKVNCCRAFPYLDRILNESKPVFLSGQVLPLVDKWLSKNELLNCRRVCNKWCIGVNQQMYSKNAPTRQPVVSEYFYKFRNEEEVDRFIETFSGHTRNPFIDGTVCIENEANEDMDPEKVLKLLRQFGKHIRTLQIYQFCENLGPFEWYRFLQEALKNTPNLRELGILEEEQEEAAVPELLELYRYMMRNPMPFIPSLEFLELDLHGVVSETVQDVHNALLLPYTSQVKTLSMRMCQWKEHYATRLVNLSHLNVELNSNENLRRLLHVTAPLKRLRLLVTCSLKVRVLLRVLKKFTLLEDVLIEFDFDFNGNAKLENGKDISNLRDLNVPAVNSLEINDGGMLCYNFLQLFTGLRRLAIEINPHIDTKNGASQEGENDLQLFKIVENGEIYDSNIWKLIPTLKNAEIRHFDQKKRRNVTHSGTRKGYNEYLSSSN